MSERSERPRAKIKINIINKNKHTRTRAKRINQDKIESKNKRARRSSSKKTRRNSNEGAEGDRLLVKSTSSPLFQTNFQETLSRNTRSTNKKIKIKARNNNSKPKYNHFLGK